MTRAATSFVLEVYAVPTLKINLQMKQNLVALLALRGKQQGELARFVRRTKDKKVDSWISHILDQNDPRELPMRYWERAAEFLGVSPYQLLQPGIAGSVSERRSGADRRHGLERRISQAVPSRPREIDLFEFIRALPREDQDDLLADASDRLNKRLRRRPSAATAHAAQDRTDETVPAAHAPAPARRKR